MDSVRYLKKPFWTFACVAPLLLAGCAPGPIISREVLADPMMRFTPVRSVASPTEPQTPLDLPIPPNTVASRVEVAAEPGAAVSGVFSDSSLRTAVEIFSGFALEAGYGLRSEKQLVQKLDGFFGPMPDQRLRHGPDGALVLDDGTSLLRLGYRYRTAWDGSSHEPSLLARTMVLSRDTVLEVGYLRRMGSLQVDASHLPAREPVDDQVRSDYFSAAFEQGLVPGWNLRLDLEAQVENGFLQSPYRLVSLWSQRGPGAIGDLVGVPQVEPEHHPDSRMRWGTMFRVRKMIARISAALELGVGRGSDSWRVEHSTAHFLYLQRLGEWFVLSLGGGGYHQTRALFYRDDYPTGPPGAFWSADRNLSSYVAWWAEAALRLTKIPAQGRSLGMFKYWTVELGLRGARAYYGWEGIASPNGFDSYSSIASATARPFEAGLCLSGRLVFEGGF